MFGLFGLFMLIIRLFSFVFKLMKVGGILFIVISFFFVVVMLLVVLVIISVIL